MKPRDSSDEGHGLAGEAGAEPASLVVAARLPQVGPGRSESGVVAAPGPGMAVNREDEDDPTSVDPGGLPLSGDQQAALARRIRNALEQTLPLGTPVPQSITATKGSRSSYARTMLLGGRQLPGIEVSPGTNISPAPADARRDSDVPESVTPPVLQPAIALPSASPSRPPPEPLGSDTSALRASFVRPVGLPTVPPPRRSRRSGVPPEREPGSEPDHEAFALDRPLSSPSSVPPIPRAVDEASTAVAGRAAGSPVGAVVGPLSIGLMLPPPPQPADYDPPSPRAAVPVPAPSAAEVAPPALPRNAPRVSVPPLLSELPSANPFEGFEAPRETFVQRSLIVFVVALAVVGLFALGAIAFGFLGKTGW